MYVQHLIKLITPSRNKCWENGKLYFRK